ncbi:MAG: L,D-transpeptidase family protein [Proteobacteria bacterium]|nr:L,D-transpeptidase family protein [Pseudomonadota bacterium]
MTSKHYILLINAVALYFVSSILPLRADDDYIREVLRYPYNLQTMTVIGLPSPVTIQGKDTLLDVARRHDLSYYNEMELLYPHMDEWIPPRGAVVTLPTVWVLPATRNEQLVINLPEQRLYYFIKVNSTVQTYPIGIGDEGWETPVGTFKIFEKRPNPTWYIPESLQAKYGMKTMPPGPDNPMGEFVMKFSAGAYGIHGTNVPWGVGGLVSHGCIRLYPEDIRTLYPQVKIGTKLEIIYEPIKFGQRDGHIYMEAHPDIYRRIPDYFNFAMEKLRQYPNADRVDLKRFQLVIFLKNGLVTDITRLPLSDTFGRILITRMLQ